MAYLPIPAKQYFDDFAFDLTDCTIVRDGVEVSKAKGLSNKERGKKYMSFLIGVDIVPGDTLRFNGEAHSVQRIDYDSYNGENQLIKAFF